MAEQACGRLEAPPTKKPMAIRPGRRAWITGSAVLLLAAGCASSGPIIRPGPSTTAPAASSTVPTSAATTVPSSTAPAGTTQAVTVTPSTGLASTQTVLVEASGFSANETLVVTECAAKGAATTAGDCDLANMQNVTSDNSGKVSVRFTVAKGPFGANNIVCGSSQPCLVSVTQATPSPTEEADTPISFK